MSKKASPVKSFSSFLLSVLAILAFRWAAFEPFVIPSGSMIPTLLINDHIVVSKYSYGLRWPFTSRWLTKPKLPKRGDIVVFRSVEKDDFYMIKRVVGLPGDVIEFTERGQLLINGEEMQNTEPQSPIHWAAEDLNDTPAEYDLLFENLMGVQHWVMYDKSAFRYSEAQHTVPPDKIFVMGDNRDRSRDSRFWGDLPLENLLGKAQYVWLSCSKTLPGLNILCDPRFIRWHRFFHKI